MDEQLTVYLRPFAGEHSVIFDRIRFDPARILGQLVISTAQGKPLNIRVDLGRGTLYSDDIDRYRALGNLTLEQAEYLKTVGVRLTEFVSHSVGYKEY